MCWLLLLSKGHTFRSLQMSRHSEWYCIRLWVVLSWTKSCDLQAVWCQVKAPPPHLGGVQCAGEKQGSVLLSIPGSDSSGPDLAGLLQLHWLKSLHPRGRGVLRTRRSQHGSALPTIETPISAWFGSLFGAFRWLLFLFRVFNCLQEG